MGETMTAVTSILKKLGVKGMQVIFRILVIAGMLSGLANLSFAESIDPSLAVVKTHSYLCSLPEDDFRGSGVLFRHNSAEYVITSEHVVLWGREKYCHTALMQDSRRIALDCVMADWAMGLALLKVKGNSLSEAELPTLQSFSTSVRSDLGVETVGFPWTEQNVRRDRGGRVLSSASQRYFLANTFDAIELKDSHGEFGMSGGAVLSVDQKSILGLLSHQYLKLNVGGETTLAEYNVEQDVGSENYLLVIPSAVVKSWLSRFFSFPDTFSASFVKQADDQISNVRRVYSEGLVFTANNASSGPCASQDEERGLWNGNSIPPALGVLGDPVGIGGDGSSYQDAVEITVEIDRNASLHLVNSSWYLPSRVEWVRSLKDVLYRPGKVSITGLLYRDPNTSGVERICFKSLEEFFRKLISPDTSPISIISSSVNTPEIAQSLEFIQGKAKELSALITHFKDLRISSPTSRWLDRMLMEAESGGNEMQWELVPVDKFRDYGSFTMYRDFWIELDGKDNDASIELRKLLIAIDSRLKQMRI